MTDSCSIKLAALRDFTKEVQADICAIMECNVDWKHAPAHLYPKEQMRYWWDHWSISNNIQETNKVAYQPSGTTLVIMNQLLHRAQWPRDNKVGLGRWCWAWLRGKDNKIIRIMLAYQPCKSEGVLTTYQQQVWAGSKQKLWTCPLKRFLQDLSQEINAWTEAREEIIVLAVMNKDVLAKDITQFCQATNLMEAIHSLHRPSPVPTHQQGRKAIHLRKCIRVLTSNRFP